MRFAAWFICTLAVMALCPGPGHGNTDLPREFDSLVPVFANARPIGTRFTRDSVTVRFATSDAFEHVAVFYAQALKKTGWRISKSAAGKGLAAVKERIKLSLTENPEPRGFMINLYYSGGRE